MVKIRLKRVGKTKQPSYRVVVADSRSPRDGRIIEAIGHYHPRRDPSEVIIDLDRARYWLDQGAQPSEQVRKLISIVESGTGMPAATSDAAPAAAAPAKPKRTVKATPAASVASETEGAEEAAETPEATDQAPAAPEAE